MACKECHKSYYFTAEDDQLDSNAKPHVCSTCGQSFSLKVQLKRHAVLHANGVPYVCINCSKDSYDVSEGYVCNVCNETFASKRSLFRHTTKEHTLLKTFTCDDCPECFESASELKRHTAVHKHKTTKRKATKTYNENDILEQNYSKTPITKKLQCHICSKSFAYQACLDKHIKKSDCKPNKAFSSAPSIKRIKSDVEIPEIDDKKHVCNICGKSFSRRTALEGHEVIHVREKYDSPDEEVSDYSWHEGESDEYVDEPKKSRQSNININQSYKCENCNFVCFSKKTLNKHMNNHKDEDSEEEENSESEDDAPKNHVNFREKRNSMENLQKLSSDQMEENENNSVTFVENPNNYPCEICEKTFASKKRLKKHLLFHVTRNQKEELKLLKKQRSKNFACEICGKRFAGKACLKKHVQKHENGETMEKKSRRIKKEKVLQSMICEFCNEEFIGKRGAFMKHVHSHTPEVCGICDERFVDRQSLREHCKIHVGTAEGKMFMECSQKALDAKNGLLPPEPKVEYIYLVLR